MLRQGTINQLRNITREAKSALHTVLTTGPNPLTILSTSSNPNVRLKLVHLKKLGSPSGPPSTEPAIRRHKSSKSKYASLAAGLSLIDLILLTWLSLSVERREVEAARSSSRGGTSTSNVARGTEGSWSGSRDEATRVSSSTMRS